MPEATAKLEFSVGPKVRVLVERAASASGVSATAFARAATISKAKSVLRREQVTALSDRDWRLFLRIVDSRAEPNAALRRAAKEHNARRG